MTIELKTYCEAVKISELVLGTMRLPQEATTSELTELLLACHDRGISTHHSSVEYETYPRYLAALEAACATGRSFQHVVKLAEPSWDHDDFEAARFHDQISWRLAELGTDSLEIVQWMSRTKDPTNDSVRIPSLHRRWEVTESAFEAAKSSGDVRAIGCFGYTDDFLAEAVRGGLVDGIVGYFNPLETNERMFELGAPILGIRPFAGGALFGQEWSTSKLLEYALAPDLVVATTLTVSSLHHLEDVVASAP